MAANIVVVRDKEKWEIIQEVLVGLREGGILISPESVEYLDENMPDWEDHLGDYIEDYDFGGDAEIWVDVARPGNYASMAIDSILTEVNAED